MPDDEDSPSGKTTAIHNAITKIVVDDRKLRTPLPDCPNGGSPHACSQHETTNQILTIVTDIRIRQVDGDKKFIDHERRIARIEKAATWLAATAMVGTLGVVGSALLHVIRTMP